jgi:8-oxo-dGTP pyrophosphatase MutT (NUDIX family)
MSRPFPTIKRLASALAPREHPAVAGAPLEAAVMVCIHESTVLLVRRQEREGDRWSGHMGLPGGRHEPGDTSLLETARRETREEVGFDPLEHGALLGTFGSYIAMHTAMGDTRIGVFVSELSQRPELVLSDEIAAAYWIDLATLVGAHTTAATVPERDRPVPAYVPVVDGEPLIVWGITYGILEQLRQLA